VTNLDSKIKKDGESSLSGLRLQWRQRILTSFVCETDLRRTLYLLFSAHGKVLDVVALKTPKMRGQAFVVFRDLQSATAARRREDGNLVLGKPIVRTVSFVWKRFKTDINISLTTHDTSGSRMQIRSHMLPSFMKKGQKLSTRSRWACTTRWRSTNE
jgi:hypothetical protein